MGSVAVDDVLDDVLEAETTAETKEQQADDDSVEIEREEPDTAASEALADPYARLGLGQPPSDAGREGLTGIRNILGVPLWYERTSEPRPATFRVAPRFVPLLEATVRQVRERVPPAFGDLRRITSGGTYVPKPGAHGHGRAIDWDRWVFANVQIAPIARDHDASSLAKRRRYWALAAICRSNSAYVLHGYYDAPHADHIHHDNSGTTSFNASSEATVKLCQAIVNEIFGGSPRLTVDGDYGPRTRAAIAEVKQRLALPGDIHDPAVWKRFLRRSARLGFTLSGER